MPRLLLIIQLPTALKVKSPRRQIATTALSTGKSDFMGKFSICDPSRDSVPFAQFKKSEKHHVFHIFEIVQIVPNRASHLKLISVSAFPVHSY